MKRLMIYIALCFLVIVSHASAIDLGKKLALRMLVFPLNPALDTGLLNIQKWPDSASIAVWATSGADTGNTSSQVVFGTSTTTVTAAGLAALGIRTDSVGTNTAMFVFADTARIINAGTTTRQLVGTVSLWRLGCPFQTQFSVFIAADTNEAALVVTDTLNAVLDSLQLHDNWIRDSIHNQSVAVLATWTSTARDSILANFADANTKLKAKLLAITDTLGNTSSSLRVDTNTVWTTTQRDSLLAVFADANAKLKAKLLAITDTLGNASSSLRVDTNTVWSTTQRDSILAVLADANAKLKAKLLAVTDTLGNTSSSLRVDTNTVWNTTQRDSLLAVLTDANTKLKAKLLAITDTLGNTSSSLRVDTNTVWSTTHRDSLLAALADANSLLKAKLTANLNATVASRADTTELRKLRDSLHIVDSLMHKFKDSLDAKMSSRSTFASGGNVNVQTITDGAVDSADFAASSKHMIALHSDSGAAGSTPPTAVQIATQVKSGLYADTTKKIGFSGGAGDSVKAVASSSVDTAAVGRSVWNNSITTRANRTVSTADTVYNTIACGDTTGADFLLNFSDYRNHIKYKVGVGASNTTWETDTVLNELIREAIVTVNPIMRGYKTTLRKVSQFDSADYSLDSLIGISSVMWKKNDTARSIPYLAREKWATITPQNTYGANDPYLERPTVYDYTDNLISFFPVPTSEDTILINGWQKIPNITIISQVSQIPQKYRVAILKYATWLVARAKQHPQAVTFLNEYHESIAFLMAGLNRTNAETPSK
jgi:hypothetical protein